MIKFKFSQLFLFIVCLSTTTCDKENVNYPCSDSYIKIESLNNVTGIVGFDTSLNKYFITKHIEGTIDNIYTLYPCELSIDYMVENLNVTFSGDLFEGDDLPKPKLGGQEIYHINLNKIANTIAPK